MDLFEAGDIFTTTGVACEASRLNYRYRVMFEPVEHLFVGSTVVDLGCHNGRWSFASLQMGAAKVIGVDADAKMLKIARQVMHERKLVERSEFHCANVEKLDLSGRPVDIVLCMGLLYYLDDPLGLLKRIAERCPRLCIVDTFVAQKNVPSKRNLDMHLHSLFSAKHLAEYDSGRRHSYHCRPKLPML